MEDWTSGYVAEIGYTYGYYRELNPVAARFALMVAGLVPPKFENACELGFGQGVSVNMHAAAGPARWWGTDFNPGQAAFAQSLAQASGSQAVLSDDAFEEFCVRTDLPDMDYIGLHGIWSWINDANRKVIVDFVRRKLKVGGVFYVSYNTQPGWSAAAPLRELFTDHAETLGAPGQGIVARVDAALAFTERLMATNPRYLQANPQVTERLKRITSQDRHYLAHEYFNRDWEPMSFAKIAKWLAPAKLTFACSGDFLDHVDSLHFTPEQLALLNEIPDPRFRQSVRDFCLNAQFRRDYWVRGPRPLAGAAHREAIDEQWVVLSKNAADISLKLGEAKLNEAIYKPLIEEMADGKPKRVGDLARALVPKGVQLPHLIQALVVLGGKSDLQPAQVPTEAIRRTSTALNRHLMNLSRNEATVQFLASPVTGGAFPVPRFDQIFLAAITEGVDSVDGWARHAYQEISRHGQQLLKEGKPLTTEKEAVAHLRDMANEFGTRRLLVYKGLGLA
ncbi:methyltransferase regulatory domain-containing protein [Ramlibacter sp. PS4R-6]|uniref:methyltransferase regulatory domain-containing protein n=1 Tax=Ramlibacter sp. PS4R-6 TaxID=3133438 RepID=UPI003095198C